MAEIIKETVITEENVVQPVTAVTTPVVTTSAFTTERVIYFILGVIEVLLGFRMILKLLGANVASVFVSLIYSLTGIFILPFEGIFRRGYADGIETAAVFEPSTLVAIIVYAILAWGIVKLIRVLSGTQVIE